MIAKSLNWYMYFRTQCCYLVKLNRQPAVSVLGIKKFIDLYQEMFLRTLTPLLCVLTPSWIQFSVHEHLSTQINHSIFIQRNTNSAEKMKELYSHKYVKPTAAEGKMQDRKIMHTMKTFI